MFGKVWTEVKSALAVAPTGTQDLALTRTLGSGFWSLGFKPLGPAGGGGFRGSSMLTILAFGFCLCPDTFQPTLPGLSVTSA